MAAYPSALLSRSCNALLEARAGHLADLQSHTVASAHALRAALSTIPVVPGSLDGVWQAPSSISDVICFGSVDADGDFSMARADSVATSESTVAKPHGLRTDAQPARAALAVIDENATVGTDEDVLGKPHKASLQPDVPTNPVVVRVDAEAPPPPCNSEPQAARDESPEAAAKRLGWEPPCDPTKMICRVLRKELSKRGLPQGGLKKVLIHRLQEAIEAERDEFVAERLAEEAAAAAAAAAACQQPSSVAEHDEPMCADAPQASSAGDAPHTDSSGQPEDDAPVPIVQSGTPCQAVDPSVSCEPVVAVAAAGGTEPLVATLSPRSAVSTSGAADSPLRPTLSAAPAAAQPLVASLESHDASPAVERSDSPVAIAARPEVQLVNPTLPTRKASGPDIGKASPTLPAPPVKAALEQADEPVAAAPAVPDKALAEKDRRAALVRSLREQARKRARTARSAEPHSQAQPSGTAKPAPAQITAPVAVPAEPVRPAAPVALPSPAHPGSPRSAVPVTREKPTARVDSPAAASPRQPAVKRTASDIAGYAESLAGSAALAHAAAGVVPTLSPQGAAPASERKGGVTPPPTAPDRKRRKSPDGTPVPASTSDTTDQTPVLQHSPSRAQSKPRANVAAGVVSFAAQVEARKAKQKQTKTTKRELGSRTGTQVWALKAAAAARRKEAAKRAVAKGVHGKHTLKKQPATRHVPKPTNESKRSTQTTAPQPVASSQAASQVAASPQAATSAPAQTHTPKPIATGTNAHASAAQATSPSRPEDNYAISDNESSSSDDEPPAAQPSRKAPAAWATGKRLEAAVFAQYNVKAVDPSTIFHDDAIKGCDLAAIFASKHGPKKPTRGRKYTTRTSSGNWQSDYLSHREKDAYRRDMGYRMR